ncbi:FAD-dependent oxidoreductase [Aestuariivirga sp.]|uniref:FAD-dependent oxidoreductase n=1 Tax=Aestuariivirga sp. TaxID=2650926 RepID=UPI00391BDB8D
MPETRTEQTYWSSTAAAEEFPRLAGEIRVDVAIIGGGIVGVTTARRLKDLGLTAAVVEARRIGQQVTGRSTAKITSQHSLIYANLEKSFGTLRARLYAEAQEAGLAEILRLATEHGISCDIERKAAFTFTCLEKHVSEIEREAEVARRLRLPASVVRGENLPFGAVAALRFDEQAQFHPVKYVAGLARTIPGAGCHVFENSRAIRWEPTRVETEHGAVTARHVVMATHLPLGEVGGYFAEAYPQAEPVIAGPIIRVPDGMHVSVEDPGRSIRTHVAEDGTVYGIAAGTAYKPGETDDERRHFAELEHWFSREFAAGPITHRWVNEDYNPMDGAPFVGWSSSRDKAYLVATGFMAWGITNGTAAGLLLADLAAGRENPWTEIFDATRVRPMASARNFVKENLQVAGHLVSGYLARRPKSFDELSPGEAAILDIGGKRIAAYRDDLGSLHAVSGVCSHMGCILGWNETDRTWDCPCHGSRFGIDGEVIHGPAVTPLKREIEG